jgi:hypothetical protein
MAQTISLVGLNKSEVLAALYNASKPQGMGFMRYDQKPMTVEEAEGLLNGGHTDFDYIKGRVMKVDLSGDELDTWGYDRDNGQGAAELAIAALCQTGSPNSAVAQTMHHTGKVEAAQIVREHLHEESSVEVHGRVEVHNMGLANVADKLAPAIDRALQNDES